MGEGEADGAPLADGWGSTPDDADGSGVADAAAPGVGEAPAATGPGVGCADALSSPADAGAGQQADRQEDDDDHADGVPAHEADPR